MENGNKTIAIAGLGKIALDQHVPAIANTSGFRLAATLSRNTSLEDIPGFTTWETLRATGPRLDALAICTPPQVRMELAYLALEVGLDVLLEKPPAATVVGLTARAAPWADDVHGHVRVDAHAPVHHAAGSTAPPLHIHASATESPSHN